MYCIYIRGVVYKKWTRGQCHTWTRVLGKCVTSSFPPLYGNSREFPWNCHFRAGNSNWNSADFNAGNSRLGNSRTLNSTPLLVHIRSMRTMLERYSAAPIHSLLCYLLHYLYIVTLAAAVQWCSSAAVDEINWINGDAAVEVSCKTLHRISQCTSHNSSPRIGINL